MEIIFFSDYNMFVGILIWWVEGMVLVLLIIFLEFVVSDCCSIKKLVLI